MPPGEEPRSRTREDAPMLDAGPFAEWAHTTEVLLRDGGEADVPCDGCTACCMSFHFVDIGSDETDALGRIPTELLAPAPGRPGHLVLGYDAQGRCPMLGEAGCSIYEHRPRSCRTYDCRVYPAAGLEPVGPTKVALRARVRRWRFDVRSDADEVAERAVGAAVGWLRAHPEVTPGARTLDDADLAALAVLVHRCFLGTDTTTGHPELVEPETDVVAACLSRSSGDR
jgi:uncharacterized protein